MEKETGRDISKADQEIEKIIDGKRCRRVDTGYTVRQFFSHETPEKGPGPGWDRFVSDKQSVAKKFGIELTKLSELLDFEPDKLPDEPYYRWESIEE